MELEGLPLKYFHFVLYKLQSTNSIFQERFQETATDSTEECEPPCYSLQVQNERIRRLERSVSRIVRRRDPGDRCHYNTKHFEYNYARCKKQYPQYVDTNTLPKNYTENLFDESVEVVIPFITECEVTTPRTYQLRIEITSNCPKAKPVGQQA